MRPYITAALWTATAFAVAFLLVYGSLPEGVDRSVGVPFGKGNTASVPVSGQQADARAAPDEEAGNPAPAPVYHAPAQGDAEGPLVIYTSYGAEAMRPLLDRFAEAEGIPAEAVTDFPDALLARLETEKQAPKADVLLADGVMYLARAKRAGMLRRTESAILRKHIPEAFRDREEQWFGVGKHVLAVFYAKDRVQPTGLRRYADLADPSVKGRLLLPPGGADASLSAALPAGQGESFAAALARNAVSLSDAESGSGVDVLRALAVGEGDVALADSRLYARLLRTGYAKDQAVADSVGVVLPEQEDKGVHVDISGAGVVQGSARPAAAQAFLEFLASEDGQRLYGQLFWEYPVLSSAPLAPALAALGEFKEDTASVRAAADKAEGAGTR
jgi:iron(III) transport system substrate-binding protein